MSNICYLPEQHTCCFCEKPMGWLKDPDGHVYREDDGTPKIHTGNNPWPLADMNEDYDKDNNGWNGCCTKCNNELVTPARSTFDQMELDDSQDKMRLASSKYVPKRFRRSSLAPEYVVYKASNEHFYTINYDPSGTATKVNALNF